MKNICLTLFFMGAAACLHAQVIANDLSTVPENIKKNADVIIRNETTFFEIRDVDKAFLSVDRIETILNENGKDDLLFRQYTSKNTELTEAEIRVYDATGKTISKFKKSDMSTVANGDGLIDDGKVTYYRVATSNYPITVEYKYEMKFKGSLFYPPYAIQGSEEGVENSSFTIKVPADLDLRYKEKNISLKPTITTEDKYKVYKWSVKNLPPFQYEAGSIGGASAYPAIVLAPNRFKMYDSDGDMTSWQKFGNWEKELAQGRDVLPDDRKAFFTSMVKDAPTDKEKIRILYQYLQKNFRYVSIQLGIGGYQPFPAAFTDQKKYGDCKGLSFYMHSVLNALGIKSYVALINSGYNEEPADTDFPCNVFNHMILCVPQKTDTLWLECTSPITEFGVLGGFTENRNALLITDNGGVLVPTPKSKASENTFTAVTRVNIADDASGKSVSELSTSGEYSENILANMLDEKKDDQKAFLVEDLGFKQPDEFSIEKKKTPDGAHLATQVNLGIERIPEFIAGNKMFITPRLYKIMRGRMPKAEDRKNDYYFPFPFVKTDTTIFKLPEGYISEALPAEKNIKCNYGTYTAKYWYNEKEKSVYSTASLTLAQNKIPAASYAQVKSFFDDVVKDDLQRIVIKKE